MDIELIQQYCLSKKGVTESLKWDHILCYCVGEKIFFAINIDSNPLKYVFKVTEEAFDNYIEHHNCEQAPHFAKRKWMNANSTAFNEDGWKSVVDNSYELVFNNLTKKLQKLIIEG